MEKPNDQHSGDEEPTLSERDKQILSGDLGPVHEHDRLHEMFEFVRIVLNPKNPDAEIEEEEEDEED